MSNQRFRIPSGGIGEIEYDIERKHWFKIEASKFNEDKAIPFLKLINDLVGALWKYYRNWSKNGRYKHFPELAQEILETANGLAKSYAQIKEYTNNLFYTSDIHTIDYGLEDYRQFLDKEPFDYPIFLSIEIKEALPKLHKSLLIFKKRIIKFYKQVKKLTPKKLTVIKYKNILLMI